MGIRPEDLHDEEIFLQSAEDTTIKAYVEVVELMGSETYLYLNVEDNNLTARVDPRSTARTGDTIRIAMDPNRLHFFDKDTEEALLVRP
jgi:multiple sugar transport system ATP-binding protein